MLNGLKARSTRFDLRSRFWREMSEGVLPCGPLDGTRSEAVDSDGDDVEGRDLGESGEGTLSVSLGGWRLRPRERGSVLGWEERSSLQGATGSVGGTESLSLPLAGLATGPIASTGRGLHSSALGSSCSARNASSPAARDVDRR